MKLRNLKTVHYNLFETASARRKRLIREQNEADSELYEALMDAFREYITDPISWDTDDQGNPLVYFTDEQILQSYDKTRAPKFVRKIMNDVFGSNEVGSAEELFRISQEDKYDAPQDMDQLARQIFYSALGHGSAISVKPPVGFYELLVTEDDDGEPYVWFEV